MEKDLEKRLRGFERLASRTGTMYTSQVRGLDTKIIGLEENMG